MIIPLLIFISYTGSIKKNPNQIALMKLRVYIDPAIDQPKIRTLFKQLDNLILHKRIECVTTEDDAHVAVMNDDKEPLTRHNNVYLYRISLHSALSGPFGAELVRPEDVTNQLIDFSHLLLRHHQLLEKQ